MFKDPTPNKFENWVCILERGTEYEVQMAKNYLNSLQIPSNILSKRDRSYSLNIGEMSMVYLYVPNEFEEEAREALEELDEPIEDEDVDEDQDEDEDEEDES
ncbi:putative signal transducing protein [Rhodohalobacter sp.]|uniref:putative signal transducing protein n=1 Tax=Rhodohalobacter sp. TaxID=1974210 RepID=UPI002ACE62E2|nr:DUF2007 domain-containing protein [Rhodohalobacter sp.]MDZ7758161.1 DUF2007 domain-containing protein [Rhodohalobacter sp.]